MVKLNADTAEWVRWVIGGLIALILPTVSAFGYLYVVKADKVEVAAALDKKVDRSEIGVALQRIADELSELNRLHPRR